MSSAPVDIPVDFERLLRQVGGAHARGRKAGWWMLGLLGLLTVSVVGLAWVLQRFETEENQRRQTADAQWLEQSVRFHFRRLEDDLQLLAHRGRSADPLAPSSDALNAGLLLRQPGVVLAQGWLAADAPVEAIGRQLQQDAQQGNNAEALAVMQDVARGLRRPAYAGPLRSAADGDKHVVWLAVPLFERGVFSGSYLARLSLPAALDALVPAWFLEGRTIALLDDERVARASGAAQSNQQAFVDLPGTDVSLQLSSKQAATATVPRTFFLVALICLLGMLGALYALRRDFVKRQRVEASLQAQVALRSAMEKAVTTGLRAWDREGRILYVNQAFCRMVGFEPAELLGRQAPLPYWPRSQTGELEMLHREVIVQGTELAGIEVQFQHKSGHLVDVLIHEAPLMATNGESLGWMSSVLDISERKRAERSAARQQERLEASGRLVAMGEVASTLAHELNQPLGALSGFANGLLNRLRSEGGLTAEELLSVVERMEQLSVKAGRIIQRVNAFARRREMRREPLEVGRFLLRVLQPSLRQRNSGLRLSTPTQPVWVEADALLLEHALLNLVENAEYWAQHGGRTPAVEVAAQVFGGQLELTVSDSGPGVKPEQAEQVFSAFFSGKEGGMGMGLAICRSVVEAHHGRISVVGSPALGGACFSLKLPVVDAASADTAQVDAPAVSPPPANGVQPLADSTHG